MSECIHGDTTKHIEVRLPIEVEDARTFSTINGNRNATIGLEDHFVLTLHEHGTLRLIVHTAVLLGKNFNLDATVVRAPFCGVVGVARLCLAISLRDQTRLRNLTCCKQVVDN